MIYLGVFRGLGWGVAVAISRLAIHSAAGVDCKTSASEAVGSVCFLAFSAPDTINTPDALGE